MKHKPLPQTFFTSDWHLNHSNVLKFDGRPFETVEDMGNKIITNMNKCVGADDRLILCGDIVFGNKPVWRYWLSQLICKNLILVKGNHDSYLDIPKEMFLLIVEQMGIRADRNTHILVSHYPYRWPWYRFDKRKIRHREHRPVDNGGYLIHGHTHDVRNISHPRMFHVGVNACDYKPVSMSAIINKLSRRV